ncbi:MAG: hypothetical protein ABJG41_05805 [Cyclobacteriaceae bacterium]
MKAATIILGIFLYIPSYIHCSSGNDYQNGVLKLENKTINAEIKINDAKDLVLVRLKNRVSLYRPKDIQKITVNNKTYGGFSLQGKYYLFEIIFDGDQKILYRENLKYLKSDPDFLPSIYLYEGQEALPIYREKFILDVFDNDKPWMKQYVKNQDLNLRDYHDLAQAFQYYKETTIF